MAGVVTDNESNMNAALNRLEWNRPILGGRCAAHVINLLNQDIFTEISVFANSKSSALMITKYIKNHLAVLQTFRDLQTENYGGNRGRALVIPTPTRWYSTHACIKSVLDNQLILRKLLVDRRYQSVRDQVANTRAKQTLLMQLQQLVNRHEFWSSMEFVVSMIEPIIEVLRKLESDKCFVSSVYMEFKWLLLHAEYSTDDRNLTDGRNDSQRAIILQLKAKIAAR